MHGALVAAYVAYLICDNFANLHEQGRVHRGPSRENEARDDRKLQLDFPQPYIPEAS